MASMFSTGLSKFMMDVWFYFPAALRSAGRLDARPISSKVEATALMLAMFLVCGAASPSALSTHSML
jgi:hypothetical protein